MNVDMIIRGFFFLGAIVGTLWGIRDHKRFTKELSSEAARMTHLLNEMQDLLRKGS